MQIRGATTGFIQINIIQILKKKKNLWPPLLEVGGWPSRDTKLQHTLFRWPISYYFSPKSRFFFWAHRLTQHPSLSDPSNLHIKLLAIISGLLLNLTIISLRDKLLWILNHPFLPFNLSLSAQVIFPLYSSLSCPIYGWVLLKNMRHSLNLMPKMWLFKFPYVNQMWGTGAISMTRYFSTTFTLLHISFSNVF